MKKIFLMMIASLFFSCTVPTQTKADPFTAAFLTTVGAGTIYAGCNMFIKMYKQTQQEHDCCSTKTWEAITKTVVGTFGSVLVSSGTLILSKGLFILF